MKVVEKVSINSSNFFIDFKVGDLLCFEKEGIFLKTGQDSFFNFDRNLHVSSGVDRRQVWSLYQGQVIISN